MSDRLISRLRGMVARAVIRLVNDEVGLQAVQVSTTADNDPDDVERLQNYGFSSVPFAGAEGVALAVGGSQAHMIVINVDDRRYRIKGLKSGEVAIYDDLGKSVLMGRDGMELNGGGQPITIKNTPKVRIESNLEVTQDIKDRCDTAGARTMSQMRTSHTGHTHTSATAGQPTSTPNQSL
ncbi:MAG: phage baseplate assembly protein V [Rhodoferax sp.]|nr:phage baseplate assembly protein V [Rhodoferax sp.]